MDFYDFWITVHTNSAGFCGTKINKSPNIATWDDGLAYILGGGGIYELIWGQFADFTRK